VSAIYLSCETESGDVTVTVDVPETVLKNRDGATEAITRIVANATNEVLKLERQAREALSADRLLTNLG
jgi:hypothetical protein